MVGTIRPQIVLFGSSIVQYSYSSGGWGAMLADIYCRKGDIVLRGYAGWNSRNALQVLDQVFLKDAAVQPSLVIVYFGGNDSIIPSSGGISQHVPLLEYTENMRKIAIHLKVEVKAIDIWTAMQQADDWLNACFEFYGLHLSPGGSKVFVKEILKVRQTGNQTYTGNHCRLNLLELWLPIQKLTSPAFSTENTRQERKIYSF